MQFAKEKEVRDTRIPRDEEEMEEDTEPVADEASKDLEEEEKDEVGEDSEDEADEADPEDGEADKEEKPDVHQIFPILIRCAEARQDTAAASAYRDEYESAKEKKAEDEAKNVIKRIEDDLRTPGAMLFSSEGLTVGEISSAVVTKLAELFEVEPDDDSVTVPFPAMEGADASTLTITLEGTARIEPA